MTSRASRRLGAAGAAATVLYVVLADQHRSRARLSTMAERLRHQSFHDPLTGLANRALFGEHLARALAARPTGAMRPAVLLLDLDGFKAVNDTLGHDKGDDLLVAVARRLSSCVRPADVVCRLGGDEFAVLLDAVDPGEAMEVANRVAAVLREPVLLGDREVETPASVGLMLPEPGTNTRAALQRADIAMYQAKQARLGTVEVYEPALHDAILDRHRLATDLRQAAARNELVLHYQPIVELDTNRIVGVEALVRWQHPERGFLGPGEFIPLAEETGSIRAVGAWVLEEACRQALGWQRFAPEGTPFGISVNLSARQLQDPGLVDEVVSILYAVEIDPKAVTLEVTETALMSDTEEMIARLEKLKKIGVALAIDDFGTGYSSLSYIRRLPVDVMKIDRSFVQGIAREHEEWALAASIVNLAASLGKSTLAEGIELGEQVAHLRALHCHLGQGYLFSKPLPAGELEALVEGWGGTVTATGADGPAPRGVDG